MKPGTKRASSRKQTKDPRGSRSRKALEEAEKQLTGAGWTIAAANRFFELESDEERLSHLCGMFSVTEDDYKYKMESTYLVDYHWGNGLYCLDKKFDPPKSQFLCRTLGSLLDMVIKIAKEQEELPQFDQLREQLIEEFRSAFFDFNAEEFKFTTDETKDMLSYVENTIVKPIRLIYRVYKRPPYAVTVLEERKVFAPPPHPDPLDQCEEVVYVPAEDEEFVPPAFPRIDTLNLADVKEVLTKYTDSVIAVIDQRYDKMEEMVTKLSQSNA